MNGFRVGLDVRILANSERTTGVPLYVSQLVDYLSRFTKDTVFFTDRPISTIQTQILRPWARSIPWQQSVLPLAAMKRKVKVFHGPAYSVPMWGNFRKIVTIHDAGFIKNPEWLDPQVESYLKRMVPLSVRKADIIIVPSACVQEDLADYFPEFSHKTEIVPMGSRFAESIEAATAGCRNIGNVGRPYLLHVGTHEPRKNLSTLLQAYKIMIERKDFPYDLVLVGMDGWKTRTLFAEIGEQDLTRRVRAIGYAPDEELVCWYRGASGYVQAAHYEGFGIATLDAYCSGLPIAATRTGWIRDHGDLGVTWIENPTDVGAIEDSLRQLVKCTAPPRDLSRWSWHSVAGGHRALYQRLL